MQAIKILIVEDEVIIAEEIRQRLEQMGYRTCGPLQRGEDVPATVAAEQPDLLLMDIMLAGRINGITAVEKTRDISDVPVIFLTDVDNKKTIQMAGKLNPAAYLLKPFNERQLHVSIQTALYNLSRDKKASIGDQAPDPETLYQLNNVVFIKQEQSFMKLNIPDILYLEAERSYSSIHIEGGEKIVLARSLNHLYDAIRHPSLLQVQRSFVVNITKVNGIKGNTLLIGDKEIPLGENYREEVMRYFRLLK